MVWPKKNSYKEFANEKKFLRLENSPPLSHNISNGPSLICCFPVVQMFLQGLRKDDFERPEMSCFPFNMTS